MDIEQLIAKLRENGAKVTPQRLAICEIILSSKEHPTADQIFEKVKKKHPTISLATVYQTLHLLSQIGMLQELGFSDCVSRYDPDTSFHINVVCPKCGKIKDYKTESIKKFWTQIVRELKFSPIGQRVEVYAYCEKCSEKT
ncbi:MAG: Fur family transcriptional regulator [Candidatus Bathyarchaeia archaeon]